LCFPYA
jgi:hypothetical protein